MGTRLYCDQCGNTVHEFKVVSFGQEPSPKEAAEYDKNYEMYRQQIEYAQSMRGLGMGQSLTQVAIHPPKPLPTHKRTRIELCEGCLPIWLTRAANLTKESDPEN